MGMTGLLTAFLIVPPPSTLTPDLESDPVPIVLSSREEKQGFRARYLSLAQSTFRRSNPEPAIAVPRLVAMYRQLPVVKGLSATEKKRMRITLVGRVRSLHARLTRQAAAIERRSRAPRDKKDPPQNSVRTGNRSTETAKPATSTGSTASLSGTEAENVQALISLIETTVEPGSWESQGGNGSIRYFGPVKALVIRQTGEVHREIGGLLDRGLR